MLVSLDFDGVIVKSHHHSRIIFFKILNLLKKKNKITNKKKLFKELDGLPIKDIINYLSKLYIFDKKFIYKFFISEWRIFYDNTKLDKNFIIFLSFLKKINSKIIVISSSPPDFIYRVLKKNKILSNIKIINKKFLNKSRFTNNFIRRIKKINKKNNFYIHIDDNKKIISNFKKIGILSLYFNNISKQNILRLFI